MESIDRSFDRIGDELAAFRMEMREEMRGLREDLTSEMRGLRSDFATLQRQLIQIGFGMVGILLAALCAVIVATL